MANFKDFLLEHKVPVIVVYVVFVVLCLFGAGKASFLAYALGFVILTAIYLFGVYVVGKLLGKL